MQKVYVSCFEISGHSPDDSEFVFSFYLSLHQLLWAIC